MKNNICGCLKKYCPHFTEAEEDNTICMAKEINKAKLLNNMKPIECINCGLLRSTCEMENGNEWIKNCQKIEGKKHEFTETTRREEISSELEEDWEKRFNSGFNFLDGEKYKYNKGVMYPMNGKELVKSFIKEILVNSNKKTLQEDEEVFWKGYESGVDRQIEKKYLSEEDKIEVLKEFLKENK